MTVSGVPGTDKQFWWGRQDILVYLVAVPLALIGVAAVRLLWAHLAASTSVPTAAIISALLTLGLPAIAGSAVAVSGKTVRDVPRLLMVAAGTLPTGAAGISGGRPVRPEPHVRIRGATWVLPPLPPAPEARNADPEESR